jgi:hypothetical protein
LGRSEQDTYSIYRLKGTFHLDEFAESAVNQKVLLKIKKNKIIEIDNNKLEYVKIEK